MRDAAIILGGLAIGGGAFALIGLHRQSPPPASVEPARLDLGHFRPDETRTATATLVNSGDRPLTVLSADSTCGCTVAQAPKTIPAHGRAPISVKYRSSATGPVRQSVAVHFAGYKATPLVIEVVGTSGTTPGAKPPEEGLCVADPKTVVPRPFASWSHHAAPTTKNTKQ